MSKHFTSIVKLVEGSLSVTDDEEGGGRGTVHPALSIQADTEESKLSLPADQPRPHNASGKQVCLYYDKILPVELSPSSLYKQTAKEVVESALLGYHGTVITLSTSKTENEKTSLLWNPSGGVVQKATKQLFRCLKKSKSKSSASNLVILCSYVMLVEEEVMDLLSNYDAKDVTEGQVVSGTHLPPKLEFANGRLLGASQHVITCSQEMITVLKYGREMESKGVESYNLQEAAPRIMRRHHSVCTLTVEFSQFGSMNAPVSGNLLFVDLAVTDPLAKKQRFMKGDVVDKTVQSLFSFASVVESLSANVAALDTLKSPDSAFSQESEASLLPCVPVSVTSHLHEKSVLTQLIRESLGGNCKTLLVAFAPTLTRADFHPEILEILKLSSRARIIQNTPNKRDLAEKALMSAYLRGLEEVYGEGVRQNDDPPSSRMLHGLVTGFVSLNKDNEEEAHYSSQHSISSEDIDDVYDKMIDATKGEQRSVF